MQLKHSCLTYQLGERLVCQYVTSSPPPTPTPVLLPPPNVSLLLPLYYLSTDRVSVGRPYPLSGTLLEQTDFDATIGQQVVSDRNLACAFVVRHKRVSGGEVKVCLLP